MSFARLQRFWAARRAVSFGPAYAALARHRDVVAALLLLFSFAATRAAVARTGMQCDTGPLGWFIQFPPLDLLRNDLARTLFFLHSQPPLFALLLGAGMKLAPSRQDLFFGNVYIGFGLLLAVSTYTLLREAGLRRRFALLATLAVSASPAAIVFEHWLYFTYPVAAMLTAACATFGMFARTGQARWALLTSIFASAVVLTRPTFHVAWLTLFAALAIVVRRRRISRRAWMAASLPAVLPILVYAKNAVLFGQPGASSWLGMNLSRMITTHIDETERKHIIAQGLISPLAMVPPFSALEAYPPEMRASVPFTAPVLRRERSNATSNYHHWAYLAISQRYRTDALQLIRRRPGVYVDNVRLAWLTYGQPATDYALVAANRERIGRYADAYEKWLLGVPDRFRPASSKYNPAAAEGADPQATTYLVQHGTWGLFFASALAIAAAGTRFARAFFRRDVQPRDAVAMLMASTVLMHAVICNLLERGENHRFRAEIDPLLGILVVLCIADLIHAAHRYIGRKGRRGTALAIALGLCAVAMRNALAAPNVALGKSVVASSRWPDSPPAGAVTDGALDAAYGSATARERQPWMRVDLAREYSVTRVILYDRADGNEEQGFPMVAEVSTNGSEWSVIGRRDGPASEPWTLNASCRGRFVRIRALGMGVLALREVEVYGRP